MADKLSNIIRRKFIDYFMVKHGHQFIQSSRVKLNSDRSLCFVNAGMNQFKSLFQEDRLRYTPSRVCNYQKCIRVGGKMNDLNHVGHDFRHHTFFEMLGNWSFNDYGKEQACEWALDFLVNELNLNMSKMRITYHIGESGKEDLETRRIWEKLGFSDDQILGNNSGDNFWAMGKTGPCGLSTEIFYPIGKELVEIWNLVFIDAQRLQDGEILCLKSKFVDTGMGLERILCVLENVESTYDTDLFKNFFVRIKEKSDVEDYKGSLTDELDINYRILADHCRMITICLADEVSPGREGAGFELRNIIKKSLMISQNVFHQETPRYLIFDLVDETIDSLSCAYKELGLPYTVKSIRRVLAQETKNYLMNIRAGRLNFS